jgi:hypothetical protein
MHFLNRILHVLDRFSVHHQESSAVYTAIGICHTGYADCLLAESGWNQLNDIYPVLCIQYWTPDDGRRNCPKHVELYSKNKLEKLVHLVGFVVRIYHDARSAECQNNEANSRFSLFCKGA